MFLTWNSSKKHRLADFVDAVKSIPLPARKTGVGLVMSMPSKPILRRPHNCVSENLTIVLFRGNEVPTLIQDPKIAAGCCVAIAAAPSSTTLIMGFATVESRRMVSLMYQVPD